MLPHRRRPRRPSPCPATSYGDDAKCIDCHDTVGIKGTAHGREFKDRSPAANHGCESCHGPGKKHVETEGEPDTIVSLKSLPPDQAERDVHDLSRPRRARALGRQPARAAQRRVRDLSQRPFPAPGDKQLKAKSEAELCTPAATATLVVNRLYRFNHMPVREGEIYALLVLP